MFDILIKILHNAKTMNYKWKYFPRVKKNVERNVFAAILRLFLELLISKWLTSNNFISIYSMKICVNMLHNFFIHLFAAHLMKSHRDIMYQYIHTNEEMHAFRSPIDNKVLLLSGCYESWKILHFHRRNNFVAIACNENCQHIFYAVYFQSTMQSSFSTLP